MENTVVGIGGKTTLYRKLILETEFALSGITENIRIPNDFRPAPKNQLPFIYKTNSTSAFYKAYKGSVGYKSKNYAVSFNYERVDPGYKTLGAYYFNNDLENFTLAPAVTLIKGKLNLNANTGVQRNNLANNKLNTTKRWVGALNASYAINRNWNVSAAFSNFSTFTRQRPQTDPFYKNTLDTFNVFQVSQSAMANVLYNFGKGNFKQSVTLSGNYQVSGQKQGNVSDPGIFANTSLVNTPAIVKNVNCGYTLMFQPTKLSVSLIGNVNQSVLPELQTIYAGPSITVGKSFYKNLLRINFGSTYNEGIINAKKTNEVLNHRCSISFAPKFANEKVGKMNFSVNSTYLQSLHAVGNTPAYNEFTGTLSLGYNF